MSTDRHSQRAIESKKLNIFHGGNLKVRKYRSRYSPCAEKQAGREENFPGSTETFGWNIAIKEGLLLLEKGASKDYKDNKDFMKDPSDLCCIVHFRGLLVPFLILPSDFH